MRSAGVWRAAEASAVSAEDGSGTELSKTTWVASESSTFLPGAWRLQGGPRAGLAGMAEDPAVKKFKNLFQLRQENAFRYHQARLALLARCT